MDYMGKRLDPGGRWLAKVFRASGPPMFCCLFCGISWPMLCCYWFRWAALDALHNSAEWFGGPLAIVLATRANCKPSVIVALVPMKCSWP